MTTMIREPITEERRTLIGTAEKPDYLPSGRSQAEEAEAPKIEEASNFDEHAGKVIDQAPGENQAAAATVQDLGRSQKSNGNGDDDDDGNPKERRVFEINTVFEKG